MLSDLFIGTIIPTLIASIITGLVCVIVLSLYRAFDSPRKSQATTRFLWLLLFSMLILSVLSMALFDAYNVEYLIIYLKELLLSIVFLIVFLVAWPINIYLFHETENVQEFHLHRDAEYGFDENNQEHIHDNADIAICVGDSVILPPHKGSENIN